MAIAFSALGGICGLVAFVCYILVKMFQNGQTGLGIAAIVTLCCAGIGHIIALEPIRKPAGRRDAYTTMPVFG